MAREKKKKTGVKERFEEREEKGNIFSWQLVRNLNGKYYVERRKKN